MMTLPHQKRNALGLDDCVRSVCGIAKYLGNSTFVAACRKSGYDKWRSEVTQALIESELHKSPGVIDYWLDWSSNKRWTPAWYFYFRDTGGNWIVGYQHDDPAKRSEFAYSDRFAACARFIKEEMEMWAEQPVLFKKFL